MSDAPGLQQRIAKRFEEVFGSVPNDEAIQDLKNQLLGIEVAENSVRLQEKCGDMVYALVAFIVRNGWSVEQVIRICEEKLDRRKTIYQSLGRRLRVGIYGGSFNPITLAHTAVAKYVMERTGLLDEVWFMPCFGHMYGKELESSLHRLKMCGRAAEFDGRLKVLDYEIRNHLSGSTYQTLKKLMVDPDYDQYELYWIIGIDCANDFQGWADFEQLNRIAKFIVVPRKGVKPKASAKWFFRPPHIYLDPDESGYPTKRPISSTQVRETIQKHQKSHNSYPFFVCGVDKLLAAPVYEYIIDNQLYANKEGVKDGGKGPNLAAKS